MKERRTLIFFFVFFLLVVTSWFLLKLASGYKIDLGQRTFKPTGLLVATSVPDGAQIFVEGKLTSATNTTIYLPPGSYEVEIKKEGFYPWKKTLKIEEALVTKAEAWLFSRVPDFRALTLTGAGNPLPSPDGSKIVYQVSAAGPEKNGLWILELVDLPFGLSREPRLLLRNPPGRDLSKATYRWSADSRQILLTLPRGKTEENFLLDSASLAPGSLPTNLVVTLPLLDKEWQEEEASKQEQKLAKLAPPLREIIRQKAKDLLFSGDETKILYTATASATIPEALISPLPGASTQTQTRQLKPNRTYVYDIKEDRNFAVLGNKECSIKGLKLNLPCILGWLPTAKHLLLVEKDQIQILEYDGTNLVPVYAGSYQFPFAFPHPSGNKLVILTTLSLPESLPNIYAVSLR